MKTDVNSYHESAIIIYVAATCDGNTLISSLVDDVTTCTIHIIDVASSFTVTRNNNVAHTNNATISINFARNNNTDATISIDVACYNNTSYTTC